MLSWKPSSTKSNWKRTKTGTQLMKSSNFAKIFASLFKIVAFQYSFFLFGSSVKSGLRAEFGINFAWNGKKNLSWPLNT